MIVFGVEDTMKALELGALDLIMIYEELDITRFVIKNPIKGDQKILNLNSNQ